MKVVIQWKQFLFCKICPAAGAAFTKWPDLNYFILKIHQNFQIIFCKDWWTFWKWLVSNNCPSKAILHVYSSCHFSHKCHLLVTLPSIPFNNFFRKVEPWIILHPVFHKHSEVKTHWNIWMSEGIGSLTTTKKIKMWRKFRKGISHLWGQDLKETKGFHQKRREKVYPETRWAKVEVQTRITPCFSHPTLPT